MLNKSKLSTNFYDIQQILFRSSRPEVFCKKQHMVSWISVCIYPIKKVHNNINCLKKETMVLVNVYLLFVSFSRWGILRQSDQRIREAVTHSSFAEKLRKKSLKTELVKLSNCLQFCKGSFFLSLSDKHQLHVFRSEKVAFQSKF